MEIWNNPYISEEMWDNYEWMFGDTNVLAEQRMMKRARKMLRVRWGIMLKELFDGAEEAEAEGRPGSEGEVSDQTVPGEERLDCQNCT